MIAVIAISKEGRKIAKMLSQHFCNGNPPYSTFTKGAKKWIKKGFSSETKVYFASKGRLKDLVAKVFDKDKFEGIVFIMALGIVVRLISCHLKNKHRDPAVVVVDEAKRFAISVLCGHEGGANKLAVRVGNILGAEPVATTASESKKKLIVGIGCRRGIKKEEIVKAIRFALEKIKGSIDNLRYIATIDLKQNELGLNDASIELGIPLRIIASSLIKNFNGKYHRSSFVKEKIGVEGVSEPCALIAARNPKLILPKRKVGRVTVAVAKEG